MAGLSCMTKTWEFADDGGGGGKLWEKKCRFTPAMCGEHFIEVYIYDGRLTSLQST